MPISRFNPDGTVDIYNTKTGEVRTSVKSQDLIKISPNLVSEYQKGMSPESQLARTKAEKELVDITSGKADEPKDELAIKKKSALAAVTQLEKLYGTEGSTNLALAPSSDILGKGIGKIGELGRKLDPKYSEDLNIFKSALANVAGVFTQAFGSGTPQEAEAKRFLGNAPGPNSTDAEAKAWFDNVKVFLGQAPTELPETPPKLEGQKKNQGLPPIPQSGNISQKIAGKVSDVLPTVGGIAGGLVGGLLGPAGALVGAGGGYAGASAISNSIRDLIGQSNDDPDQIEKIVKGSVASAAFEGLGIGIGAGFKLVSKGGNFLLKSLAKNIDDIPLKSIRFKPSQTTNFAAKHSEDVGSFMTKRGYLGENAVDLAAEDAAKWQAKFDTFALNKDIKIPIASLGDRFSKEISSLAGGGERIVPSVTKDVSRKLLNEWGSIVDQARRQGRNYVTPEELTLFRRTLDDMIPDSQFIEPSIKNVNLKLRTIMNDLVAEPTGANLIGVGEKNSFKALGKELSKLYDFLEFAEKQSGLGRGSLVANITRILSGGTGGLLGLSVGGPAGAVVGGVAGLTGEALLREPQVLKNVMQVGKAGIGAINKLKPAVQKTLPAIGPSVGATLQFLPH